MSAVDRAAEALLTPHDVGGGDDQTLAQVAARAVFESIDTDDLARLQLAHQEVREADDDTYECLCGYGLGNGFRLGVRHADHQAEAVKAHLLDGTS